MGYLLQIVSKNKQHFLCLWFFVRIRMVNYYSIFAYKYNFYQAKYQNFLLMYCRFLQSNWIAKMTNQKIKKIKIVVGTSSIIKLFRTILFPTTPHQIHSKFQLFRQLQLKFFQSNNLSTWFRF